MKILHINERERRVLLEGRPRDLREVYYLMRRHGTADEDIYKVGDDLPLERILRIADKKLCVPHHERSPEFVRLLEAIDSSAEDFLYVMKREPDKAEGRKKQVQALMQKRVDMLMTNRETPKCDRSPEIVEMMEDLVCKVLADCLDEDIRVRASAILKKQTEARKEHYGNTRDEAGNKEYV